MAKVAQWVLDAPKSVTIHKEFAVKRSGLKETDQQQMFFKMLEYFTAKGRISEEQSQFTYHVPNQGTASRRLGARRKREGVQAGVWDISHDTCAYNEQYGRLRIEMKVGSNGLSEDQIKWAWYYEQEWCNTRMAVCYTAEDAMMVFCDYFGIYNITPGDLHLARFVLGR